jgi:hypothetical protein
MAFALELAATARSALAPLEEEEEADDDMTAAGVEERQGARKREEAAASGAMTPRKRRAERARGPAIAGTRGTIANAIGRTRESRVTRRNGAQQRRGEKVGLQNKQKQQRQIYRV